MLISKTAKTLDGLNSETVRAYHKYYISKNFVISVVGMSFENNLENGGKPINLIPQRSQR